MKRNNFEKTQIDVEDFIDSGNKSPKKNKKKLGAAAAAVVLSLAVAGSAIMISSAAPADDTQADTAIKLSLSTNKDTAEDTNTTSGVYLVDVSDVVDEVLPSVVSITSRSLVNYYGNRGGYFDGDIGDIFEYFFGESFGGRSGRDRGNIYYEDDFQEPEGADEAEIEAEEIDSGMGSGTIVAQNDDELLILTSYHVVEGSSSLYVTFINDTSVDGYIKSADKDKDIAIVAVPLADIDQETLDSINIAKVSLETPKVGDGVIVIGNALGYGISVTTGIISALDREITAEGQPMTVIQTDAAINWGNSGGCMVNENGEIVGIPEAKAIVSYVEGMCYAIPVYSNFDMIEGLLNSEGINSSAEQAAYAVGEGPFLGIRGRDVTMEVSESFGMPQGVYVANVIDGSGAFEAGILAGDIITGFDGKAITGMEELQAALAAHTAGDKVTLTIERMTEGEYVSQEAEVVLSDRIS